MGGLLCWSGMASFRSVLWSRIVNNLLRFRTTFTSCSTYRSLDGYKGRSSYQNNKTETDSIQLSYFNDMIFILTSMTIKQSIALMLLRYTVEHYQKKMIYTVTFCLQFYGIIFFFLLVFQCTPISFRWMAALGVTDGRCVNPIYPIGASYGFSALFVVYDLTMAFLPWLMVRKLRLDFRTKFMVTTVLAFGSM